MSTNKDITQLTEAYEQILKEGIENKSITDRLRDKAAKSDRMEGTIDRGNKPTVGHVSQDTQITKWSNNPDYQKFLQKVQSDIFVGLKYGEKEENVKKVVEEFARLFVNYAIPTMAEPKSMFNTTKG